MKSGAFPLLIVRPWLLGLALVSGLAALPGRADAASRQLSVPSSLASPGMLVQIPLLLDQASGLASVRVLLNFNPQLLALKGVATGPLGGAFELSHSASDGVVMLLFTRETSLVSGSGRLAVLTFQVNPGAETDAFSPLTVAELQFGDDSGITDLAALDQITPVNGRITVNPSLYLDGDSDGLPDRWETTHGLSMLDPDTLADPDGDGVANLTEYALGLDPLRSGQTSLLPAHGTLQIGAARYLTLTFRRLLSPPPGLSYHVEESSDLQTWTPLDPAVFQVAPPVNQGDGTESLTVQGTIPLSGPEAEPRGFMHLRINRETP